MYAIRAQPCCYGKIIVEYPDKCILRFFDFPQIS
jgi:hypothetical protein